MLGNLLIKSNLKGRILHAIKVSTRVSRCFSSNTNENASLVIFDKDGTLIYMEAGWAEWTVKMTNIYADILQKPIQTELFDLLGYDPVTQRFTDGLACDTDDNIMKGLSAYLTSHGMEPKAATQFAKDNYFKYDQSTHTTKPIDDPKSIITQLREHGIKTAVCTSDGRAGNDAMLSDLGIGHLVDWSLCGDDEEMKAKPYPGNIHHICEKLGVSVQNTLMVGDSMRDVKMGKAAGVRASVGVLSGVCGEEELATVADVVIPSIKDILQLAIPDYK